MIQLIDADDVKKKRARNTKNEEDAKSVARRNKRYHLLRWKIKRFLTQENIIKKCISWRTILDVFDLEILSRDDLADTEIIDIFKKCAHNVVEHHTKYKEIHGIDETLWMTPSEHRNLHNRLRNEGKCNISSEELTKISIAACERTEKSKQQRREYYKTDEFKRYNFERMKKRKNSWISFDETLAPNIRLREYIFYYNRTGTVTISSRFHIDKRRAFVPEIQID